MHKKVTPSRLAVSVVAIVAALVLAWRPDTLVLAALPASRPPTQSDLPAAQGLPPVGPPATPEAILRGGQALPPVYAYRFEGDVRHLPSVPALPLDQDINQQHVMPSRPESLGPWVPDAPVPAVMPAPSVNFAGLSFNSSCTGGQCGAGYPPDTVGDVGPNHYVQGVNTAIGIFDKTGARLAAFTFNSLWAAVNTGTACDNANAGDPTVVYDPMADRWIIGDLGFTSSTSVPYYECLAVSMTGDPVSGGWYLMALRADDAAHHYLNDYPKMGIWPDGLYMTANEFQNGLTFRGVRVWAINRTQLEAGVLQVQVFDLGTSVFSLLPANLRGLQPPAGTPEYLVSEDRSLYAFDVYKLKVDWNNSANSVLSGPTRVSQTSYGNPDNGSNSNIIPQPDTSTQLDSLGDRLMMQLQYRNIAGTESLWTAHTVRPTGQSTGPTGIQWAQLNVTGGTIAASPVQQQIFTNGGDGLYRWVPSIAVDRMGNAAVGYSTSSSTSYPSIEYAGRLFGDTPGTLGQGKAVLQAGSASQDFNCGGNNPCSRWGDYTAMTVDPVDDCTFWYVGEYYATAGASWSTRIGSFKYPSCLPPVAITNLTIATDANNVKLSWTNPPVNDSTDVRSNNTNPYFAPAGGADRGAYPVPTASWSDVGVIGDATASTIYYIVLGQVAGIQAAPSGRVGLFEFALASGAP